MRCGFVDLRGRSPKDEALKAACRGKDGARASFDFVDPAEFSLLPGTPFVYWTSDAIRELFTANEPLEAGGRESVVGLQTSDDFRFLRLAWEVPASAGSEWRLFAKGGSESRYFSDLHLNVLWGADGHQLKVFAATTPGSSHWSRNIRNPQHYFANGITFPARPHRRGWMYLVSGAAFGHLSPMVFVEKGSELSWLAVLNSSTFHFLAQLLMSRGHGNSSQTLTYEKGLVASVPVPMLQGDSKERLAELARRGWSLRRLLDTAVERSHAFVLPALLQVDGTDLGERASAWAARVAEVESDLDRVQVEVDSYCFALYGISQNDRQAIVEWFQVNESAEDGILDDRESADRIDEFVSKDRKELTKQLVSWTVGVGTGRFDFRLATPGRELLQEPDPFSPLTTCSPGMLVGENGMPLREPPSGYPIEISPYFVCDPGHPLDLSTRIRTTFDVMFGLRSDVWWGNVGEELGGGSGDLSAWLKKGFFDYHLKMYSKSRRKAPILWPLGTRSASYLLWLYADRATNDSLFQALHDVVEPKASLEEQRLTRIRHDARQSPSASQRREIDKQAAFVDELRELAETIESVAPLWAPDLNDGIVIVLAPLWRLFAHHRAWSKELKAHWTKLAAGGYDWAQLAMRLWPERVVQKCAEDRSLAIAHGLEDVFWVQGDSSSEKWHPRKFPTTPVEQLIAQRLNPAVVAALAGQP